MDPATAPAWTVWDELRPHQVSVTHAMVRGRIEVLVDGAAVAGATSHWRIDTAGIEIPFRIGARSCVLRVRSAGRPWRYAYALYVDGRSADGGEPIADVVQREEGEPPPWLRGSIPSLPIIVTISGWLGLRRADVPVIPALVGLAILGVAAAAVADRLSVRVYRRTDWSRSRRHLVMAAGALAILAGYMGALFVLVLVLLRR